MTGPLLSGVVAAGGLTDFDTTLFWSTLLLFVIFAFVMAKLAWNPLLAMIEEREKGIRDSVEGAQKASTEAQALLAQHQELLREGGRQREEIVKRAIADAEQLKADLSAQARTEAEQIVRKAREQIDREKNLAIQELRTQVADLAIEAASRIVTTSMTPDAQRKLVNDFIDKLPAAR
jgi:F-type H+-transporting ATPase subunit b